MDTNESSCIYAIYKSKESKGECKGESGKVATTRIQPIPPQSTSYHPPSMPTSPVLPFPTPSFPVPCIGLPVLSQEANCGSKLLPHTQFVVADQKWVLVAHCTDVNLAIYNTRAFAVITPDINKADDVINELKEEYKVRDLGLIQKLSWCGDRKDRK